MKVLEKENASDVKKNKKATAVVTSRSIIIDPMTPIALISQDVDVPTKTGGPTKARENLALQWSDGSDQ
ncbi:hypothetical protein PsorP6_009376 [Peronosclerospora sorghi]|uniref:Uncharacterized protein n=1 Tax=Peronosclerospora sorghi TaxID=230839 RepID=A0ACC0VYN0_9STRA|nr:hypothetical protein PsorP6_009376 [Peronosclerospora sorghi]